MTEVKLNAGSGTRKRRRADIGRFRASPSPAPSARVALWALVAPLILSGCDLPSSRCGLGERPMMFAQLFFGRNIGSRHGVSDRQFEAFVDQVLTRHFPSGLTRTNATGHWRASGDQSLSRERADVVTVVVPDSARAHESLEAIRRAYMARFRQESVLLTHLPVCARF